MAIRACGLVGLLAVVVAAAAPGVGAEPAPAGGVKLGVLTGMFRDVPPDLVQAVAAPFQQLFKRQTGIDGEIEVFADYAALATKLDDKEVQFGVFHGYEWAWARAAHPNLRPLVVTIPPGKKLHACLVVHTDAKAEGPADLPAGPVVVPAGTKAHCHVFLDRLRDGLPAAACRPEAVVRGADEVLDQVATGKATAALVDATALVAYVGNKPGLGGQLKVLAKSEPFPAAVVVYRVGGVEPAVVEKVRSGLLKAASTAQGKAFMVLWRLKGFDEVTADYEADLAGSLKAYPPPK